MTGKKRKALLATVLGLAAITAAIPMVVSGTASAQENARLCGRFWVSENRAGGEVKGTGEVVVRLYEVTKGVLGDPNCSFNNVDHEFPDGFPGTLREQGRSVREWSTNNFDQVVCEDWKTRGRENGGLNNQNLNFIGNGFPAEKNQTDICQNMNRNETILDKNIYWLYDDNLAETAGVDFHRE